MVDPSSPVREKSRWPFCYSTEMRLMFRIEGLSCRWSITLILTIGLPDLLGLTVAPLERCLWSRRCHGGDRTSVRDWSRTTQILSESVVTKSHFFFLSCVLRILISCFLIPQEIQNKRARTKHCILEGSGFLRWKKMGEWVLGQIWKACLVSSALEDCCHGCLSSSTSLALSLPFLPSFSSCLAPLLPFKVLLLSIVIPVLLLWFLGGEVCIRMSFIITSQNLSM